MQLAGQKSVPVSPEWYQGRPEAVTIQSNHRWTQMNTDKRRPEPHFSAAGIRSPNSDRERSNLTPKPSLWHLCLSVVLVCIDTTERAGNRVRHSGKAREGKKKSGHRAGGPLCVLLHLTRLLIELYCVVRLLCIIAIAGCYGVNTP